MSARNSSELIDGVAYWRRSTDKQEESIPQQRTGMLPRCQLERVRLVREFQDDAKSGPRKQLAVCVYYTSWGDRRAPAVRPPGRTPRAAPPP
jgi:hypothetical protein